jgi:hypothetical protein
VCVFMCKWLAYHHGNKEEERTLENTRENFGKKWEFKRKAWRLVEIKCAKH